MPTKTKLERSFSLAHHNVTHEQAVGPDLPVRPNRRNHTTGEATRWSAAACRRFSQVIASQD